MMIMMSDTVADSTTLFAKHDSSSAQAYISHTYMAPPFILLKTRLSPSDSIEKFLDMRI